jgi:hypothetical protein
MRVARPRKRRQLGGHNHCCHILDLQRVRRHGDPKPLQHIGDRLHGKQRAVAVACAFQSDHDAVAHQLVGAHAAHLRDVLQSHRRRSGLLRG